MNTKLLFLSSMALLLVSFARTEQFTPAPDCSTNPVVITIDAPPKFYRVYQP